MAPAGKPDLLANILDPGVSVLERIELARAGHRDRERPQRVQHLHAAGMLRQYLRQPPMSHRAFVEIGADERDTAALQPGVHFRAVETPLGLLATKQAAGAVDRRIK